MTLVIKFLPARTVLLLRAFRPEAMQDLLPKSRCPWSSGLTVYGVEAAARVLRSLRYLLQPQQKLLLYYTPM